ncbi:MAG: flagellar basal-body rod protein FlgF [Kiloniellales bacterium]
MENATYVGLSMQMALETGFDVIANNIANVNTTAYQAQEVMFTEYLANAAGSGEISYIYDVAVMRDVTPGPSVATGNPLDVAIVGEGYFMIETANGIRYTRNGSFRLDGDGQLVSAGGGAVLGEGDQPFFLTADETAITISRDGTVSTENGAIGRLRLVTFENEQEMIKVGDSLFTTEEPPLEATEAEVIQGMIEQSNVQAVLELTRMIEVSRAYQRAQQIIEAGDQLELSVIRTLTESV